MSVIAAEQVLVVPTSLVEGIGRFQGFEPQAQRYLDVLLAPGSATFQPRAAMERDPAFKQLIPYCLFRHCGPDGSQRLFEYTRGSGQGESRLHQKRSIGVGGHISTLDVDCHNGTPYELGLRRELDEEVELASPFVQRCVGLINDDETEVGRVHLGIVHLFDLERPEIRPREPDLLSPRFRPVQELLDDLEGMESWSAICLRALFADQGPP